MAQIEVRGLGANEIRIGRRRITPATEVVFALAFYLCVRAGERLTRDEVVEVFWGTADVTKGRHSLRQMLYKLRQRGFALDEDGEELYLDPDRLVSDVSDALLESWSDDASVASLESSLDLVPALTKGVSSRFHEWLDSLRARLGAQHRRAAIRHLHQARREGRWADLDRIALLMLRTDPLNEEATLARAESAAMIGSKALALEILDQYVEELGDKATKIGLPATVLRRRISERGNAERFSRYRGDTRLVGRESLMMKITPLLDGESTSRGHSIHLVGSPGVGKTRVASEVLGYASLLGYRSVTHRAQGLSSGLPLATVVQLIRQVSELPGAAAVSTQAWALASRLLVEGSTSDLASSTDGSPISPSRLSWLLSSLVESVTHESRLVLLIDDLHNWDSVSESVLMEAVQLTRECRCLWLSTSRRLPRSQYSDTTDRYSGTIYRIPPLTIDASKELAEVLASCSGSSKHIARAHSAAQASGGNPLFIRELLAGSDQVTANSVPTTLSRIIEERLGTLPTASQRLLRIVRLLGPYATIPVVSRVMNQDASVPTSDIEQLEHEGIITIISGSVLSIHECWQTLVDSQMSTATKAALTYECAVALRAQLLGRTTAFSAMFLGELFLASGSDIEAHEHLQFAAERFTSLGLATHASRAYGRIVESVGPANPEVTLLAKYAASSHSCGQYRKCFELVERLLSAPRSETVLSEDVRVHLLALRVDCLWRIGGDAKPAIDELLDALGREQASGGTIQAACFWGLRCVLVHSRSAAEQIFVNASAKAARLSGQTVFGALVALMYAAERGSREEILLAADAVSANTTDGLSPLEIVMATRLTATALRHANEHRRAEDLLESAVRTAVEHELINEAKAAAYSAAYNALDTNRLEDAERWIELTDTWTDEFDSPNILSARSHALSRLFAQQGRFRESLSVFEDRIEEIESDLLRIRSGALAACLHWAASECDEIPTAQRLLAHTQTTFLEEAPSMQMDFIAECRIRTLMRLGRVEEASAESHAYLHRIGRRSEYPFAPFFRELERRRIEYSASSDLGRSKNRVKA